MIPGICWIAFSLFVLLKGAIGAMKHFSFHVIVNIPVDVRLMAALPVNFVTTKLSSRFPVSTDNEHDSCLIIIGPRLGS